MLKKSIMTWLGPIIFIGVCLVCIYQPVGAFAFSELEVEFLVEDGSIEFDLQRPVEGEYPEDQVARFSIFADRPVTVTLIGSKLVYQGEQGSWVEPYQLNVVYWVYEREEEKRFFLPEQSLELEMDFSDGQPRIFTLGGQIRLDDVTGQPAGQYAGTIWVTVSEN